MNVRRRVMVLAAAAVFCAAAHVAPTAAEDPDEPAPRVKYSEISRLPAPAANRLLTQERDAVSQMRPSQDVSARVIGGEDVELQNFREVVRIRYSDSGGRRICTGVIVSPDAILTAGHCACGFGYQAEYQQNPVEDAKEPFQSLAVLGDPILFPGYDCANPVRTQIGRDLALLRIEPFDYTREDFTAVIDGKSVFMNIPVVRSSVQVLSQDDIRSLYIVGFGATESGLLARNLQGAAVSLLSRHCQRGWVFFSICAAFREFALGGSPLAADDTVTDSCGGDSGGPAYRMDTDAVFNSDGLSLDYISHRTLVGIVSRALAGVVHPYPGYCGGGGIYTAVGTRPVLEWLRSNKVDFVFDSNPDYQPDSG